MNNYYVYGYSDPTSCDPYFYIGKGSGKRAYRHLYLCKAKATRFHCKLFSILEQGIKPEINFFQDELTEQEAIDLEIKLIALYGRLENGGMLYNLTDGDIGPRGYIHSKETKEKIRNSCLINCKGTNSSWWNWLDRQHSIDTKLKQSSARLKESKEIKERRKYLNRLARGNPICSYNLITNQIIKVYLSIREVEEDGYSRIPIYSTLSGEYKEYDKLGWRYLTKEEINSLIKEK